MDEWELILKEVNSRKTLEQIVFEKLRDSMDEIAKAEFIAKLKGEHGPRE